MMSFLLVVFSCDFISYSDYWPNFDQYPEIENMDPNILTHRSGGQEITIQGSRLADVQTVVIGSRNAVILSSSENEVVVEVPSLIGGDAFVDLTLVTESGYVRKEESILITDFASNWWTQERGSISIVSLECPVEAYGVDGSDYYPIFWCGLEMGYSYASGIFGTSHQAGFSADLSGMTPLSSLPNLGEAHYYNQQLPQQAPIRYDAFQIGDSISISAKRDFLKDASNIDQRMELFEENYYWSEDLTNIYPTIAIFDEQECYVSQLDNPNILENAIEGIEGEAKIWMGFGAVENYEGDIYEYEGYISSAELKSNEDATVGLTLDYSDYSGTFEGFGINNMLGVKELHSNTLYDVTMTKMGVEKELGNLEVGSSFNLTWPYLIGGQEQISKEYGYIFEWSVDDTQEDIPSLVVAEFRIYDMDVQDPSGWFEVGRLVKGAAYQDGYMEFTSDELSSLPLVPNAIDEEYEFIGLWGEMSISKHQFFTIPYEDDEVIIDIVEVVQSPVDLVE
jgi:hypothetical protein